MLKNSLFFFFFFFVMIIKVQSLYHEYNYILAGHQQATITDGVVAVGLTSCPSNLASATAQWWDTTTGVTLSTSSVACVNVSGTWSLQLSVPTIDTAHGDYAFKINTGAVTSTSGSENTGSSSSSAGARSSFIFTYLSCFY